MLEREEKYMNTFSKEQKLIIKEQEFQNQDLEQRLKHMDMDIELMKNIKMEE